MRRARSWLNTSSLYQGEPILAVAAIDELTAAEAIEKIQIDFEPLPYVLSLSYQPMAMRWRAISVLTNTPPRGAQRAPGGMQGNGLMEPVLGKASRKLGIDYS